MQPIQTLREFASTEERGVSSVIGVVLMVAVAVILAAVIATFALGIGNQTENTTPSVQFDVTEKTVEVGESTKREVNVVVFKHQSGKSIKSSNLKIEVNGRNAYGMRDDGTLVEPFSSDAQVFNGGEFKVGNKVRIAIRNAPTDGNQPGEMLGRDFVGAPGNSCTGDRVELTGTGPNTKSFEGDKPDLPCSVLIHEGDTIRILFTGGDGNPGVITTYELDEPVPE